jgi:hypothetical protein
MVLLSDVWCYSNKHLVMRLLVIYSCENSQLMCTFLWACFSTNLLSLCYCQTADNVLAQFSTKYKQNAAKFQIKLFTALPSYLYTELPNFSCYTSHRYSTCQKLQIKSKNAYLLCLILWFILHHFHTHCIAPFSSQLQDFFLEILKCSYSMGSWLYKLACLAAGSNAKMLWRQRLTVSAARGGSRGSATMLYSSCLGSEPPCFARERSRGRALILQRGFSRAKRSNRTRSDQALPAWLFPAQQTASMSTKPRCKPAQGAYCPVSDSLGDYVCHF